MQELDRVVRAAAVAPEHKAASTPDKFEKAGITFFECMEHAKTPAAKSCVAQKRVQALWASFGAWAIPPSESLQLSHLANRTILLVGGSTMRMTATHLMMQKLTRHANGCLQ